MKQQTHILFYSDLVFDKNSYFDLEKIDHTYKRKNKFEMKIFKNYNKKKVRFSDIS